MEDTEPLRETPGEAQRRETARLPPPALALTSHQCLPSAEPKMENILTKGLGKRSLWGQPSVQRAGQAQGRGCSERRPAAGTGPRDEARRPVRPPHGISGAPGACLRTSASPGNPSELQSLRGASPLLRLNPALKGPRRGGSGDFCLDPARRGWGEALGSCSMAATVVAPPPHWGLLEAVSGSFSGGTFVGILKAFWMTPLTTAPPACTRDARASCCPPLSTSPCLQHKGGCSRPLLLRRRPQRKPFGLEMARSWLLTWSPRRPLALSLQQPSPAHTLCILSCSRAATSGPSSLRLRLMSHTFTWGPGHSGVHKAGKDLLSVLWALNSGYQAPPRQLRPR